MNWQDIPGFMTEAEGNELKKIAKITKDGVIVEVGSYKGRSTKCIAEELDKGRLFAVDTFMADNAKNVLREDTFNECMGNVSGLNVTPLRGESTAVARDFDLEIDFLFIDGNHEYSGVRNDIRAWMPKLKKGGYIAFHDYSSSFAGVVQAIDDIWDELEEIEVVETILTGRKI